MKLALKLVALCLVAMILITAISNYFIANREYRLIEKSHKLNAKRVAGLVRESIELAYNSDDHQGIMKLIKTHAIDSGDMEYRWVWFDVSKSVSTHPAAPMNLLEDIKDEEEGEMDSVIAKREGPDLLYTYYRMDVMDRSAGTTHRGAIEISESLANVEMEFWDTTKKTLYAMVAMTIFCLGFIAWAGIRFIGRPLKKLTEQTRLIGAGIYDHPIKLKTNDELGELAVALNAMSEKISGQLEELRHADRLKTVGRLVAGVAHEVGTPLNVISGRAGLIRGGKLSAQEMEESACAIQSESDRIAEIVRQLMDFGRQSSPKRTFVDLRIIVERTIDLLRTFAEKRAVTIEMSLADQSPYSAFVDESQIQQVLTNIIVNAFQAMTDGGQIDVVLQNIEIDESATISNSFVRIEIRDNGPGMDRATLDQIFEPFFTTKDVGTGTGLGLSIAHGIVQEHGGEIEVESHLGKGTTFSVLLPKSLPKSETAQHSNMAD